MAEEKEEMEEACSLAKRLPLGEPALPEPQKDIPNTPNTPENASKNLYEQMLLFQLLIFDQKLRHKLTMKG